MRVLFTVTATQHDHLVTVCHGYVREFNTSKEKLSVLLWMLARIFHSKISLHTSMIFLSWAKLKNKTFSKSWTEFYLTWETTDSSSKKQCVLLSSAEYLGHNICWVIEAYTTDIVWAAQQPPVSQLRSFLGLLFAKSFQVSSPLQARTRWQWGWLGSRESIREYQSTAHHFHVGAFPC